MSSSIFGFSSSMVAPTIGVKQNFVATVGQTIFTLTLFTYTPGTGTLDVFIQGALQTVTTDYTETNSTTVTLVEPCLGGELVTIKAA